MEEGKLIALYGINGIGKSTQANRVVEELEKQGKEVLYLKYPIYDLEPEGPFLYKYLRDPEFREANKLDTHALQEQFAENRRRYQPELTKILAEGTWIVAEDYIGTAIAWGMTWAGSYTHLNVINADLRKADVEILLDGEQFDTAIEKGHQNEDDVHRVAICRNFLWLLGKESQWPVVKANQDRETVTEQIMEILDAS